jgi:hypothetical protein
MTTQKWFITLTPGLEGTIAALEVILPQRNLKKQVYSKEQSGLRRPTQRLEFL